MQKVNEGKVILMRIMVIGFLGCVLLFGVLMLPWKISQRKISPNEKQEVVLIDSRFRLFSDRNFQVKIGKLGWLKDYKTIFISPDEVGEGAERFIWSKDNTKILLVAKNLFIVPEPKENFKLTTGEYLYLFYDLSTNQKWCNCSSALDPTFTFDDISKIEFEEALHPFKSFPN